MAHAFLSDSWFDEVARLTDEINPEVPAVIQDLKINMVVTGTPDGDREMRLDAGRFERGLVDDAPTKLTVPYETAQKMFVENDQQASMQAFMSGQIKVEGDMAKLMQMQAAGAPSPESVKLSEKIREMTG